MKQLSLYLIILLCGSLALTACHDDLPEPEPAKPDPWSVVHDKAERTVIVYMAADNSLNDFANGDLNEMRQAAPDIPANVNFIIYLDKQNAKPVIYQLTAQEGLTVLKQYDEELNSVDSQTMLQTLRDIEMRFPAEHYAMSFWSHGTGWIPRKKSFGEDSRVTTAPKEPNKMNIPELASVLGELHQGDNRLEYIFFDACFMQSIEVAYELRHVTRQVVGSPAEIPGPGAPYKTVVKPMCEGSAEGILYEYDKGYPLSPYTGVLLSCIDCSKLDELVSITGRYLTPHYMNRTTPADYLCQYFQPYCTDMSVTTHCYDMCTTMYLLLSEEEFTTWMEAFGRAVPVRSISDSNSWYADYCRPSRVNDPEHYGGVSMFVPKDIYDYSESRWNDSFRETSWYKDAGWEVTGW